jgi:hypothetical protein
VLKGEFSALDRGERGGVTSRREEGASGEGDKDESTHDELVAGQSKDDAKSDMLAMYMNLYNY